MVLNRAAELAAPPASLLVAARWELASVSGVVASHVNLRPLAQGIMVIPSGLKGDPTMRPAGSRVAGMPALTSALQIVSLIKLWRRCLLYSSCRINHGGPAPLPKFH